MLNKNNEEELVMTKEEVESVCINYKDGSQKVIKKGVVSEMEHTTDSKGEAMINLTMTCCNMSGKELVDYIYGIMNIYARLDDDADSTDMEIQ